MLRRILGDAVRDRVIGTNGAIGVKIPARTKRKNVYLTAEQLALLMAEAPADIAPSCSCWVPPD